MDESQDSVMILFMGRNHQHAITSIQHYLPNAVHIITSDDFRKAYVRRLNDWSKKYGFRKGTVQSVSDLFESTSVESLLNCVYSIAGHEHRRSEGEMETYRWMIGLTGGTMVMSAVATIASGVLDANAFYVLRPKEGEAIMPKKDIVELPALHALKFATILNPKDVIRLLQEGSGDIEELVGETNIENWMIGGMQEAQIIELHPEMPKWRLTSTGKHVLTMMTSGPAHKMMMMSEFMRAKAENEKNEDTTYHG